MQVPVYIPKTVEEQQEMRMLGLTYSSLFRMKQVVTPGQVRARVIAALAQSAVHPGRKSSRVQIDRGPAGTGTVSTPI